MRARTGSIVVPLRAETESDLPTIRPQGEAEVLRSCRQYHASCILYYPQLWIDAVVVVALPSYFHFVGSEEKVSRAKRIFISSYLGILYLAPVISNPYLNFKLRRRKIIMLAPQN